MDVSFTFLGSLLVISTNPDLGYEGMVGAIIMGGIFEGIVGLSAKYWRRFWSMVSFICWNVYSNRVSGFALFTKGCV